MNSVISNLAIIISSVVGVCLFFWKVTTRQIDFLREDVKDFRQEVREEMKDLRQEMKKDMADLRQEMKSFQQIVSNALSIKT